MSQNIVVVQPPPSGGGKQPNNPPPKCPPPYFEWGLIAVLVILVIVVIIIAPKPGSGSCAGSECTASRAPDSLSEFMTRCTEVDRYTASYCAQMWETVKGKKRDP